MSSPSRQRWLPAPPTSPSYDPYDEDERFEVHQQSFVEDTLRSIGHDKRVKSATVVEIASGSIISTTCATLANAALVATHAPSIVSRASLCAQCSDGDAHGGMLMVCISSRLGELIVCADAQRRWAVLVEQEL